MQGVIHKLSNTFMTGAISLAVSLHHYAIFLQLLHQEAHFHLLHNLWIAPNFQCFEFTKSTIFLRKKGFISCFSVKRQKAKKQIFSFKFHEAFWTSL